MKIHYSFLTNLNKLNYRVNKLNQKIIKIINLHKNINHKIKTLKIQIIINNISYKILLNKINKSRMIRNQSLIPKNKIAIVKTKFKIIQIILNNQIENYQNLKINIKLK